jgi:hypothetical protein
MKYAYVAIFKGISATTCLENENLANAGDAGDVTVGADAICYSLVP